MICGLQPSIAAMAAMSRLLCICLAVGCVVGYVCTWGATWLWGIATAGPHSISLHLPVEHPLTRPSHVPWHPHAKQSLAGGVFGTDLKQHPLMQSRSRVASYVGDGRGSGWYVSLQGRVERTFGSLMIWVLPMLISLALLRRGLRYCLTSTAAAPQLQEAVLMGTETPTPSVSMSTLTGWAQVPTTTWCLDHEKVLLDGREPAPRTIAELSEFSVTTFNIQAPMYKRLPEGARESEKWHLYIPRNQRILGILLQQQSSAFCLQVDNLYARSMCFTYPLCGLLAFRLTFSPIPAALVWFIIFKPFEDRDWSEKTLREF